MKVAQMERSEIWDVLTPAAAALQPGYLLSESQMTTDDTVGWVEEQNPAFINYKRIKIDGLGYP
jgi:hypothetical protein